MSILQIIRAASFGICFYAGIYHLLVGMRRSPIDRIHLIFALTALAFAFRNFGEIFFNAAASDGRLSDYLFWGHLAVIGYILGLIFLTWFVTVYTKGKPILIPLAITLAWFVLLVVHQNSPYFYLFTEEPVFVEVILPWGEVVTYGNAQMSIWADLEWIIIVGMVAFYIYASVRQYLRGERREALMIGFAVTIYMGAYTHDVMLDYDMINSLYILAQAFVLIIIMMSLTLSNEIIYTENTLETLNLELEQRIDERTKDLSSAKQKAEAASKAKSVFLANMSHELRTPLNAILGHAQILARERSLKPEQQSSVKAINRSGDHLLTLINSVLEMSKIEAGQAGLNPHSFTIYSLLNDLDLMFGNRIREKGIAFVIDRDLCSISAIKADKAKIGQILINMLNNAVRHTKQGSITLRVKIEDATEKAHRLIFEVADTGKGIVAEELERIFEPFVQSDVDIPQQTGTGLGLAISRQYAQMMEGELTVESQVGQGSIFHLKLPFVEVETESHISGTTSSPRVVGMAGEDREYRVLVVDDESSNRDVIIRMLSPADFDTRQAIDGQEAIDIFGSWFPHLILMDIRMPKVDGFAAIKAIKSTEKGKTTPIIGVSASVFEEDKHKILESGADDFIAKPIQEAELWDKIGQSLNVEFLFDDQVKPAAGPPDSLRLTRQHIAEMPDGLVTEMRTAVQGGYMERLTELARSASEHHPGISQQLLELVEIYDYEALSRLFLKKSDSEAKG